AYRSPEIVSRIEASSRWTIGWRSGITRRIQSSISAWLSDATGGFRVVSGLRALSIARSPLPTVGRLSCSSRAGTCLLLTRRAAIDLPRAQPRRLTVRSQREVWVAGIWVATQVGPRQAGGEGGRDE